MFIFIIYPSAIACAIAKGFVATETLFTCTSVVKLAVPEPVTLTALVKEPLLNEAVPSVIVVADTLVKPLILDANPTVTLSLPSESAAPVVIVVLLSLKNTKVCPKPTSLVVEVLSVIVNPDKPVTVV